LRYNLQWNTPSNGGYAITNIYIKYAEVSTFVAYLMDFIMQLCDFEY